MFRRELTKFFAPLRRRVALMVGRCVILATNDAKSLQELQISALADEELDRIERIQEYGFTSHAHAGAEGVIVCVGGNRNHALVIAVDDKRYRLTGLEMGEVAIYDDLGQKIVLKRTGIEIETKQDEGVKITAPKVQIFTDIATLQAKSTSIDSDKIEIKANSIKIDCPNTSFVGNLAVSGNASLGDGARPVARLGDKIRLTSGDCIGETGEIITADEHAKV